MNDRIRSKRLQLVPRGRFLLICLAAAGLSWLVPSVGAQDPAAERLFREAQRLFRAGDGNAALTEYSLLLQQFPDDRLAPQAALAIVELQDAFGDELAVERGIDRLLDDYARSPEAARAFLLRGQRLRRDATATDELEQARATLRRIPLLYGRERYPELDARLAARIESGEISLLLDDAVQAENDFLAVIENEPPSRLQGLARRRLAAVWLLRQAHTSAAELLQSVVVSPDDTATDRDRGQARRLLSLLHRRWLNPLAGHGHWQRSESVRPAGLDLRQPIGIAAAEDDELIVVDKSGQAVLLDETGKVLAKRPLDDIGRPGWTDDGKPFVTPPSGVWMAFSGERIDFTDPRSDKGAPLKGAEAVERGPLGDWFVLAKGFKSLLRFDTPRRGWTHLMAEGKPDLVDLARDAQGRILALDRKAATVSRITIDRRVETLVQGSWKKATALAVDALGFVYVLDRGERRLELYDPAGQRQATLGPLLGGGIELRDPEDLTVDGSGRVWIVDSKSPFLIRID